VLLHDVPSNRTPKIARGSTLQIWEKKHFTRPPTLVCSLCPMVLGDIFSAQNNSGKGTITTSVFLSFQIFDMKNLANTLKTLAPLVQFTLGKQNFLKFSQFFCQKTTKLPGKKNTP
jgi:hypothetical protein